MDKLNNLVYLSLPEKMIVKENDFQIDPSILLPIECTPENLPELLRNLSWEMIIAAILKILVYDPTHKDTSYYRKLVKKVRPNIITELTQAAFIKSQENDFEIAEEILTALTKLSPKNLTCRLNLALFQDDRTIIYHKLNNIKLYTQYKKKAKTNFDIIFNRKTTLPLQAYYFGGLFYARTTETEKAVKYLEFFIKNSIEEKKIVSAKKALQLIMKDMGNSKLFKQAYEFIEKEQNQNGINLIKEYLKTNQNSWYAWFLLGWGYRKEAKYEKAIENFLKALKNNKESIDIYNELAICSMELKNFKRSKEYLSEALKIEPENAKILSNMAVLNLKEKNINSAIENLEKVLLICPGEKTAENLLQIIKNNL